MNDETGQTPPAPEPTLPPPAAVDEAHEDVAAAEPLAAEAAPAARRKRGFGKWLLILLVLVVLALAAWYTRPWWQGGAPPVPAASRAEPPAAPTPPAQPVTPEPRNEPAPLDALEQRLSELASQQQGRQAQAQQQAAQRAERLTALQQQLAEMGKANAALAAQVEGLGQRTASLEAALAKLAQRRASGAERMRLDDVEMLLTQASQRYKVLGDGEGALAGLRMAREELGQLDDAALAGVVRTLDDEISALAASRPDAWTAQLAQLQALRERWPGLPLKPVDQPPPVQHGKAWQRVREALGSLVVISHDAGKKQLDVADARLTRQSAEIDLVQAQAALLRHDQVAAQAALQRARAVLAAQFDTRDAAVKAADQQLAGLIDQLAQAQATDVQLGAALTALRNQRHVRRMNRSAGSP